jgi:hypothetical protein
MTFSVSWTVPSSGRFGFTTLSECRDLQDATDYFLDAVRGKDPAVPADVQIDNIRKL